MEKMRLINTRYTELMINRHVAELFTNELLSRGMDVAIAEGVTGGSLIDAITIPGSTRIIHVGGIFYSTDSKINQLGVSKSTIERYGEYSPETAREMAVAMLKKSGATLSIASVGHLEPQDSSSRRYVALGFSMKGRQPWVKTIFVPPQVQNRRLTKNIITQCAFSHALHYLRNNENIFHKDELSYTYVNDAIASREINTIDTLAAELIKQLQERKLRLATIESCTAGAVANAVTDISGASRVFDMGWLAYDENLKSKLGVSLPVMVNGNVYSLKVAQSMAEAILSRSNSDVVIATTGTMETIDTRPFHSDTLPGTIYAAVIFKGYKPFLKKIYVPCPLDKTREQVKIEAVSEVLTFANKSILELPKAANELLPFGIHCGS